MKILAPIFVAVLVGCGNPESWFYGEWIVDEEKTLEIAGEKKDMLGASLALMKNSEIKVDKNNVTVSSGDSIEVLLYELIEEDDGSVIISHRYERFASCSR